jgi:hypothetical protein
VAEDARQQFECLVAAELSAAALELRAAGVSIVDAAQLLGLAVGLTDAAARDMAVPASGVRVA